jgi:hypothetical protein
MLEILSLAKKYGTAAVEDASQNPGAKRMNLIELNRALRQLLADSGDAGYML